MSPITTIDDVVYQQIQVLTMQVIVVDWTNAPLSGTDFMVGLNNSHVQFIVQAVPLTNTYRYLSFIRHLEK